MAFKTTPYVASLTLNLDCFVARDSLAYAFTTCHWVLENAHLNVDDVLYCASVQWDVQGAIVCGMKVAWLKRAHIKDTLEGIEPH